eukprot:CAMPEP_0182448222 /NCGR_PEP_ID=MMETSP1172-20130603/24947_1 /TAXON_ID=708627 /ORGANISM="Timspurckia oligopyrenoides, Strain CCMP3278" /LENGTH=143 /DNA_ID=CAMNT_0024645005 /DNA_START=143 /DNA_END=574 /DNA_ORIENTATION=+
MKSFEMHNTDSSSDQPEFPDRRQSSGSQTNICEYLFPFEIKPSRSDPESNRILSKSNELIHQSSDHSTESNFDSKQKARAKRIIDIGDQKQPQQHVRQNQNVERHCNAEALSIYEAFHIPILPKQHMRSPTLETVHEEDNEHE